MSPEPAAERLPQRRQPGGLLESQLFDGTSPYRKLPVRCSPQRQAVRRPQPCRDRWPISRRNPECRLRWRAPCPGQGCHQFRRRVDGHALCGEPRTVLVFGYHRHDADFPPHHRPCRRSPAARHSRGPHAPRLAGHLVGRRRGARCCLWGRDGPASDKGTFHHQALYPAYAQCSHPARRARRRILGRGCCRYPQPFRPRGTSQCQQQFKWAISSPSVDAEVRVQG
jgi:hypothetical protein